MTGSHTLLARLALGSLSAAAGMLLTRARRPFTLGTLAFNRTFLTVFTATRIGLYGLLFFVLRISPRGDVPAYYVSEAEQALKHLVIYRDFWSNYAPLHPYLDAALLSLWHSPLALILFAIMVEIATLPLWLAIGRAILPEPTVRLAALLYLASPISLQYVAVDGQNNILISALLAASIYAILKRRELLAGALLGLSIAAVKFLPLIFIPAYLACTPRRLRLLTGIAAVVGITYGIFLFLHAPILIPLRNQGSLKTAGNLWFLLEALFGMDLPFRLLDLAAIAVIIVLYALITRASRKTPSTFAAAPLIYGVAAITLAVLLLSKKSWPPYLIWALFPICLLIAAPGPQAKLRQLSFAIFSVVAVTEHSLWSTNLNQTFSLPMHQALLRLDPWTLLFCLVEVILVAGYTWLLILSAKALRGPR